MTDDWAVVRAADESIHVVPERGKAHDLSGQCWCEPKHEEHDRDLWIHNEIQ